MLRPDRVARSAIAALILIASIGIPAIVAEERSVQAKASATLDGEPISLSAAADYSCHDLEAPIIRCFRDPAEMVKSADKLLAGSASKVLSSGYVIAYENSLYGGASRLMSISYDNLGSIGWNDRISSFKSFGASGAFREHAPPAGFAYSFGTSTQVSYVGDAFNDKFSSLQLD
jgi:hypothetical protein